jgi:homoserine O-succinyltransferase
VKQTDSLSIFFQGHPEYSATALLGEYRRDVTRFLSGDQESYPAIPSGYFSANVESELGKFRERALSECNPELMRDFAPLMTRATLHDPWFSTAVRIYENWLLLLSELPLRSRDRSTYPMVRTEPDGRLVQLTD